METMEGYNPEYPNGVYYFSDEQYNYKAHKGVLYRKPKPEKREKHAWDPEVRIRKSYKVRVLYKGE